jgi:hypothetical protein
MTKFLLTITIFFGMLAVSFADGTNTPPASTTTNINQVVIEMLEGVKVAGGEIYTASKTAISDSVDFASKQTPLVVKEFLRWKLVQAILYIFIWSVPTIFCFCLSYRIGKWCVANKENDNLCTGDYAACVAAKWITRMLGIAALTAILGVNLMTITQIIVAPRVYLIEYVVHQVQSITHTDD